MKVKQLKEILEYFDDDADVSVRAYIEARSRGGESRADDYHCYEFDVEGDGDVVELVAEFDVYSY